MGEEKTIPNGTLLLLFVFFSDLLTAGMSQERYWRGSRSREVYEEENNS